MNQTGGKVCPLCFASPAGDIEIECRPDRCAWAYNGGCAMATLARCLDDLNEKGIITWMDDVRNL